MRWSASHGVLRFDTGLHEECFEECSTWSAALAPLHGDSYTFCDLLSPQKHHSGNGRGRARGAGDGC
jgi:hypothetical protein